MPNETKRSKGTPTANAELVGELMSCVADLESGTGPDGSHAQIQHPHADLLRRAAEALARQGEAQEIGEFIGTMLKDTGDRVTFTRILMGGGWRYRIEATPIGCDAIERGGPSLASVVSSIRSATTPQTDTKESPNA